MSHDSSGTPQVNPFALPWVVATLVPGSPDATWLKRSYTWGLDLSGSLQGAGGVGGLLAVMDSPSTNSTHFTVYDGNGNVTALVNAADGAESARYDHGPFGELLRATGPMARVNPFRFSTKYQDEETGWLYYGYRYYDTSTGRWLSRDPIGEEGGIGLYALLSNEPIAGADYLGFADWKKRAKLLKTRMLGKLKVFHVRVTINGRSVGASQSIDREWVFVGTPDTSKLLPGPDGVRRNGDFAGTTIYFPDNHPLAHYNEKGGVPVKPTGEIDFSNYIYKTKSKKTVEMPFKKFAEREADKATATAFWKDQLPKDFPWEEYTWHHTDDLRLVLVPNDLHSKIGHTGGFSMSRCSAFVTTSVGHFVVPHYMGAKEGGPLENAFAPALLYLDISPMVEAYETLDFGIDLLKSIRDAIKETEISEGPSILH